MSYDQTKNGKRNHVRPGTRSCTIVAIMFTEPSSDDRLMSSIPASHHVWPSGATSASGGYEVQPELAAPPGEKKPTRLTWERLR